MIDFDTEFLDFAPTKKDGYIEIKLPILIDMSWWRLTVRVVPHKDGSYTVTDEGVLFAERGNRGTEYYYNHFIENAPPPHYGIKLKGDFFYKKYAFNFNPIVALDEFIRFFIAFEEHIDKYELLED